MEAVYHAATKEELACLWEKNVLANPADPRWAKWAREYTAYNENGMGITFAAVLEGEPVGEATLLLSPACGAIEGRLALADGKSVGNVNALRMEKRWEGQGHMSRLVGGFRGLCQEAGPGGPDYWGGRKGNPEPGYLSPLGLQGVCHGPGGRGGTGAVLPEEFVKWQAAGRRGKPGRLFVWKKFRPGP